MPRSKTRPVFSLPSGGETSLPSTQPEGIAQLWRAYRMRWRRRRLLVRAIRKRRELHPVQSRVDQISETDHLAFATVRNERARLPYFLEYHRALGINHFLIVVNDSTDGTAEYLAEHPDVSVWTTKAGYKQARFGMDWLNWLLMRYGHGHWCLTLDADELFVSAGLPEAGLRTLTTLLDQRDVVSFGALMIDLYPKGPLDAGRYEPGQNPLDVIPLFDAGNFRATYRDDMQNLWIQGGVRDRVFFADRPHRAPTLSKVPLVKWNRRFAYVSSTHTLLPRRLNHVYDTDTGALLHTKFLPGIVGKSREEAERREHFADSAAYQAYYDAVVAAPDLSDAASVRFEGWAQLAELGLINSSGSAMHGPKPE